MKPNFNYKFFQRKEFDKKTICNYFRNAVKDFQIASKNKEPAVIFNFSYSSLIKTGVTIIAFYGYRIKSRKGHHIQILEKLSQILNKKNIEVIGEKMRKKRNLDLYNGGIIIDLREATQYKDFVKEVIREAKEHLKSQNLLF